MHSRGVPSAHFWGVPGTGRTTGPPSPRTNISDIMTPSCSEERVPVRCVFTALFVPWAHGLGTCMRPASDNGSGLRGLLPNGCEFRTVVRCRTRSQSGRHRRACWTEDRVTTWAARTTPTVRSRGSFYGSHCRRQVPHVARRLRNPEGPGWLWPRPVWRWWKGPVPPFLGLQFREDRIGPRGTPCPCAHTGAPTRSRTGLSQTRCMCRWPRELPNAVDDNAGCLSTFRGDPPGACPQPAAGSEGLRR